MRNKHAHVTDPHSFLCCVGDRQHKLYQSRFDGSRVVLEESGSFDIQESINSYAPYTDISYMLNRLAVGDNSVFSSRTPLYGDFSGMPDNPADAINLYHNAESAFGRLSAEEKLTYNNDFRVWLASLMGGNPAQPDSISGSVADVSVSKDASAEKDVSDKKE